MSVIERLRTWGATASAVVLLIVAALALIYDGFHRFGLSEHGFYLASPEEVLIFLIALLCFGIGTERLLTLHNIEGTVREASEEREKILQSTDRISTELRKVQSTLKGKFYGVERSEGELLSAVSKINRAQSLIGTKQIEDAAISIVEASKDNDNITASQYSNADALSDRYINAVTMRLKKAKLNQGNMEYRVSMPAKPDSNNELADRRREIFREEQVEDRLIIDHTKRPWPFEVLIVGSSMIIALRGVRQRATYEVAVRINDPEFVEKASEWYREVGEGEAESYS